MASNYDDVLSQLTAAGLVVDHLIVGRMVRCKVDGDREKRGWYSLHDLRLDNGTDVIVGSFGVWRGNDAGTIKVELRNTAMSREQTDALRKRLAEDRKRAEAERQRQAEAAARGAGRAWQRALLSGESTYLQRKGVGAHGCRFSESGSLIIPVCDVHGTIHGLQIIRGAHSKGVEKRPAKEFWPAGIAKKGRFHLIGRPEQGGVILLAEGYATAASIFDATGLPTVVAFDAGNLAPVADELLKRFRGARILVCADDDAFATCPTCQHRVMLADHPVDCPKCANPHGRSNAGVSAASATALAARGHWLVPIFADEEARRRRFAEHGVKLTDFNDLHQAQTLHAVRSQIIARLSAIGWDDEAKRRAPEPATEGAGESELRPINSNDEMQRRFALVYGHGGMVFDRREHCLIALSDLRDACQNKNVYKEWQENPDRSIVRIAEVGFDPAGTDPAITCNLWAGWPTKPKAGRCDRLLELLFYMCSADDRGHDLYQWVLRWIAYPLQHPGAKMRSTLVIHGPQGTGKNMFFEALLAMYGPYGRVIDQSALEDKFNSWASRKLLLIADEVIARSDLYHVKNKLKAFITGDRIRINPKNLAEYEERNHVNLVFLSNELMPVVLEEDDRRHCVIWTPTKLSPDFYAEVAAEIAAGGIAALHDHLLHLDLGNFGENAHPPETTAKRELIELSRDSVDRFWLAVIGGEIDKLEYSACLSSDLYEAYKLWCNRSGTKHAPLPKFIATLKRKHVADCERKRYLLDGLAHGPHGVVIRAGDRPGLGEAEQVWLGRSIGRFKSGLSDYRGQAHG